MPKWKDKKDQVKVKTKQGCLTKAIKKGVSKKHDEKTERHNDSDIKSLGPWNNLWAYKSLSLIVKSHSLHYVPLKALSNQTSKQASKQTKQKK